MRLVGRDIVDVFAKEHSDARSSLVRWTRVIEANSFKHLVDLKRTFPTADYVRPYTVFDIAGDRYRLITIVDYALEIVTVTHVMTHREYDEQRWRAE